jgi:hypothetical protein
LPKGRRDLDERHGFGWNRSTAASSLNVIDLCKLRFFTHRVSSIAVDRCMVIERHAKGWMFRECFSTGFRLTTNMISTVIDRRNGIIMAA